MAKTGDVQFINVTANVNYDYMLVETPGTGKRWRLQQLFTIPPSLIKSKVDMTILAAPSMRQANGDVISNRTINTVLTELRTLTDKLTVTELNGLDNQTYKTLLDNTATAVRSVKDETGRIVQYEIDLSLWDLYVA